MGGLAENSILLDEEEDKENSLPTTTTTPVSDRLTRPPALLRSRSFGKRIQIVPDYVYTKLFQ